MPEASDDLDEILASFVAVGAGHIAVTIEGRRGVWGIQCGNTIVDDSWMRSLLKIPHLHAIGLSNTCITNAAMLTLANLPELESLDLDGTCVDDGCIQALGTFPHLEFLHLQDTLITREGIRALWSTLPNCEIVSDYDDD